MDLKERTKNCLNDYGIKVAKFTEKMNIGYSSYYLWMSGKYKISEAKEKQIDAYLKALGY